MLDFHVPKNVLDCRKRLREIYPKDKKILRYPLKQMQAVYISYVLRLRKPKTLENIRG